MKINKFEDIIAWQKAGKLSMNIYSIFHDCRDFGFANQIQRASISIMNNIAEGFERNTNKEFRNFLFIAKGSCAEVRSMLYIAVKINYISDKQFSDITKQTIEISKLLSGLIKTL
ncbi:MAG: four helix bundle protein [Patescibacteria group bacterium]|jgi:four helix bundle protein